MPNEKHLSPGAIPVEELACALAAVYGKVTLEMLCVHMDAGVPTNTDGTMNAGTANAV